MLYIKLMRSLKHLILNFRLNVINTFLNPENFKMCKKGYRGQNN